MKPISLPLVLIAFLFSCNNNGTDKQADGSDPGQAANSGKRTIQNAIFDLKATLESRNPNKIADLMDFPVPDTVMNVYLDDSAFQKEYKSWGEKLSRPIFLKYYDTISKFTYLDKIAAIFKYIPLDSLQYTNELKKELTAGAKEPCAGYYSIRLEDNIVTLTYGTNINPDYEGEIKGTDETEDGGCEYGLYYIFRFDGQRLRLIRQGEAG
jgi:hypothetical protein